MSRRSKRNPVIYHISTALSQRKRETPVVVEEDKPAGKIRSPLNEGVLSQLATVLGVPSHGLAVTSSTEDKLYQVNIKERADLKRFGHIRSRIIDLRPGIRYKGRPGVQVARAIAHTADLHADEVVEVDGMIHLLRGGRPISEWKPHPVDQVQLRYAFEGTLLIAFVWNDRFHLAIQNNIRGAEAKWPGHTNTSFADMWQELGGPSREELFGEAKYSPYCHLFFMVHIDVMHVSRIDLTQYNRPRGFITYLGWMESWELDYEKAPYKFWTLESPKPAGYHEDPRPDAGLVPGADGGSLAEILTTDLRAATVEVGGHLRPTIYDPTYIDPAHATYYLRMGLWNTPATDACSLQHLPGECVMLQVLDENKQMTAAYRVVSPAYQWRLDIMYRDSPLHRLFVQSDLARNPKLNPRFFDNLYGDVPLYNYEQILSCATLPHPPVVWISEGQPRVTSRSTFEERLRVVWCAILMATPLHRFGEILNYYATFFDARRVVAEWLTQVALQPSDLIPAIRYSELCENTVHEVQLALADRQGRTRDVLDAGRFYRAWFDAWALKCSGQELYTLKRELDNRNKRGVRI